MDSNLKNAALELIYKTCWNASAEQYERCIAVSDVIEVPKGINIVKQGEIQDVIYFLVDGIIRGVSYGIDGKVLTDCIMYETGAAIYAGVSLTNPIPATDYVNTVTKCTFVTLPRNVLNAILEEDMNLNRMYVRCVENVLEDYRMLEVIRSKKSVKRYSWFCERHPKMVGVLPKECILSYLDISEEAYRQALALQRQQNTEKDAQS